MNWSNSLVEPEAIFVADTSVLINLNATGRATDILGALPCRLILPENVYTELEFGRQNGHGDADALEELCRRGCAQRISLGDVGTAVYETLIDGSTLRTLDDGEAATIGCAIEHSGIALIDERKARNLCAAHFPELSVVCTAELLLSAPVADILGESGQVQALLRAIRIARMRVPKRLAAQIDAIIGENGGRLCR